MWVTRVGSGWAPHRRTVRALGFALILVTSLVQPAPAAAATAYETYLASVLPTLHQWWTTAESARGFHFLVEPTAANTGSASQMATLLGQWWPALESWRGFHFLVQPTVTAIDTPAELYTLLDQWQGALDAFFGFHAFSKPPLPAVTDYETYLINARPVLHQWWTTLESARGFHFLIEPIAANTGNASQMATLLGQWWPALEKWRGFHFLVQPTVTAIDTSSELSQLLNQWQDALDAFFGLHAFSEPPLPPLFLVSSFQFQIGTFRLVPRHVTLPAGRVVTFILTWTVPPSRGWRDLDTIDLRVCGDDPILWVRWSELTNTFQVFDDVIGDFGPPVVPQSQGVVETSYATVFLSGTTASGSGPEGKSVTLAVAVAFKAAAAGRACRVEVAATDDLGSGNGFRLAGTLRVTH